MKPRPNYSDNGYDKLLRRSPTGTNPNVFDPTYQGMEGEQTATGAVSSKPVENGRNFSDLWLQTFIRSRDWKPGARGFALEGRSGKAEFNNVALNNAALYAAAVTSSTLTDTTLEGEVDGSATITMDLIPTESDEYNLGNTTYRWQRLYTVNSVSVSSDARGKTNITDLSYGLAKVMDMRPVIYDRADEVYHVGFLAQEMLNVVPEVVSGDEQTQYGISYEELVPVLVKAIQELKAEFEAYKTAHP